jgi:signal transduction histidine kinase
VSTRFDADADAVEVAIADTGSGIPESARNQVFDPFFTTKEVGKGTGQGLAIARSVIVNKHGGTLRFETECGKGTTFFIRLPLNTIKSAETRVAA